MKPIKPLKGSKFSPSPADAAAASGPTQNKNAKAYKKAYHAYHNARQRCCNPKSPSYPGYGGAGVKFLFQNFDEFLASPGLPPHPALTLERINPHGHYEPSNVRWASKIQQAGNKKKSLHPTLATLQELISKAEAVSTAPKTRLVAVEAWNRVLSAIGRGYFEQDDATWFAASGLPPELFNNPWKLSQVRDLAFPHSYFHLPSLTWPGHVIRVRGGPIEPSPNAFDGSGTMRDLGFVQPEESVPRQVIDWILQDISDPTKSGAVWLVQPSDYLLRAGGVEGWMFSAASRLRHRPNTPRRARFCPAVTLLGRLTELGAPYSWSDRDDGLLKDPLLFVPDLQLDIGEGYDFEPQEFGRIRVFLEFRRKAGLKSFVGIQNPHKLPPALRTEVLGSLRVRELNELAIQPITAPALPPTPMLKQKPGGMGFADLASAVSTG